MNLTRTLLLSGAMAAPLGIIVALMVDPTLGGVVVGIGVASALAGLHRFGRSGVDRTPALQRAPDAAATGNSVV